MYHTGPSILTPQYESMNQFPKTMRIKTQTGTGYSTVCNYTRPPERASILHPFKQHLVRTGDQWIPYVVMYWISKP